MTTTPTPPIIGIGASAGGLDALKQLFQSLPADTGAAFVIIQHLDPAHVSLAAEIMARYTAMPAAQVIDGMAIEADHVYVIPPNAYLTISEHRFQLGQAVLRRGLRMPIDTFFQSLAEQHLERAVAIVVSGTGRDGTSGIRAIKANGGMVLVQSPETAQFDGMPRSAIASGQVDFVCPVDAMSVHLTQYLQHPYIERAYTGDTDKVPEEIRGHLSAVVSLLKSRTGYDFNGYKLGTLGRRIERRMSVNHVNSMVRYLEILSTRAEEPAALLKDLLIGVTSFFRDPNAFQVLDAAVISALVDRKRADEPIRIWVPACASGEEVYSIAMLLMERLDTVDKHCPVQIFASDLDEDALAVARTGSYSETIATDLSPERLRRFFIHEDHSYRVTQALRENVTFAVQNVTSDPPFSRLDFVSCRNLLIYLKADIQRQVLALFHFALGDDGYLFLGHSESVNQQDGLFDPVDKKWRIYRRLPVAVQPAISFPGRTAGVRSFSACAPAPDRPTDLARLKDLVQQQLLQAYGPAAVLVNSKHQVLYYVGPTTHYLEQPSGAPTQDLMILAQPGLRATLRVLLKPDAPTTNSRRVGKAYVIRDGSRVPVQVTATPLTLPKQADLLRIVTFEEQPSAVSEVPSLSIASAAADLPAVRQLEQELASTRQDMQSLIEEQESANEELQAANEEVMSVNEEMQSANEELETSKEELQAMNEELTTVNNQLKEKKLEKLQRSMTI